MVSAGEAFFGGGKGISTLMFYFPIGARKEEFAVDWIWRSFWRLRTRLQQGDSSLRHHG